MLTLLSRTACVRPDCKFGVERHATISDTFFFFFFFQHQILFTFYIKKIPQRRELSAPHLTCWPCSPELLASGQTVSLGWKGMLLLVIPSFSFSIFSIKLFLSYKEDTQIPQAQRRELSAPSLTCWPCSPELLASDRTVSLGWKGMLLQC